MIGRFPRPRLTPPTKMRFDMSLRRSLVLPLVFMLVAPAAAQIYNRPPPEVIEDGQPIGPDPSALSMRIDRLEREMRRMTGQMEEMQHKTQMLEEQLRAARDAAGAHTEAAPGRPVGPSGAVIIPAPSAAGAPPSANLRRGDAFDPAANPNAPGAPRPIGAAEPSAPLANPPRSVSAGPQPLREPGQPLDISRGLGASGGDRTDALSPSPADLAPAPAPKDEYEQAVAPLRSGQYETAEKALTAYLAKNGKSKYAAAATFNLGESFFLRGRHREAAEKYLEISTKYAQSSSAPEAMLRLGQSLYALDRPDAKEQACASFLDLGVKYPSASARIKDAAAREAKKIQC